MYSIDTKHLVIKKADGGKITYNHRAEGYKPSNEFDLYNQNTYSESGALVVTADQNDYDWQMAFKIKKASPVYRIEDLLNHHYQRTPDKPLFLKHIRYHILGFLGAPKPMVKEITLKWLDEKEKQISRPQKGSIFEIPQAEIKRLRALLIRGNVLTEDGESTNQIGKEKFRSKPIIALLIKELSDEHNIPETEVFRQVKMDWKLNSMELKNYKKPAESKLGDYEGYLDSITSQS